MSGAGWGHSHRTCSTCPDRAELDAVTAERDKLRAALVAVCSVNVDRDSETADAFRSAMRPHRDTIAACRPSCPSGDGGTP